MKPVRLFIIKDMLDCNCGRIPQAEWGDVREVIYGV